MNMWLQIIVNYVFQLLPVTDAERTGKEESTMSGNHKAAGREEM